MANKALVLVALLLGLAGSGPADAEKLIFFSPAPVAFEQFGVTVAADGGVVAAGVPLAGSPPAAGAIYTVDRTLGPGWPIFGPFRAPVPALQERFGHGLELSGGHLFVAASRKIYYLTRDPLAPEHWIHRQVLTAPGQSSSIGVSMAAAGDYLVAGDHFTAGASGLACGVAFVFHFDGAAWNFESELNSAGDCNPFPAGYAFGYSVDLSGDTIAVGSVLGSVHIFRKTGGTWQHEAKILPQPDADDDYAEFGRQVRIEGDRLLVSSPQVKQDLPVPGNRAYVYERAGTTWSRAAVLVADVPTPIQQHGFSLALRGDLAVVGSPEAEFHSPGNPDNDGAAYSFLRQSDGSWPQVRRDVGWESRRFGDDLDFDGDLLWVGAPDQRLDTLCCYGAVYAIDLKLDLFADGFESGGTAAWFATVP